MRHLSVRHEEIVADPLQQERLLRALRSFWNLRRTPMPGALYARVSTPTQHQEGTIVSQVQSLRHSIHQQGWSLRPDHE